MKLNTFLLDSAPFPSLFIILLILSQSPAFAQDTSENTFEAPSWSRFEFKLGGFLSSNNSGIRLGSQQLGVGLQIDVEDALGLETSTVALRLNTLYRFGKTRRNAVTFGYFDIRRTAKKVLEEDIEIGDEVFPIGTEISSRFDLSIIRLKYAYSFFHDDRVSLGASFGFYIMPIGFSARALNFEEQSTQFVAPLPLIGFYTNFRINEKLYLNESLEFLYLSIQNFSGRIIDFNIAIEHQTFKHFGFGLGANLNGLSISIIDKETLLDFIGDIRMDYSGIMLFGKYYF